MDFFIAPIFGEALTPAIMFRHRPPLSSLAPFEAAARHQSFRLAADELHVTPSAISHRITALETSLGVKLFRREKRKVTLTEAGQAFFDIARGIVAQIDSGAQMVVDIGRGTANLLTVHSAPSFATKWLMPRLPEFLRADPNIHLRIQAAYRDVDFETEEVDVDIRYGRGDWPGLCVTPLTIEAVAPMCSPALVEGDPPLRSPEDLRRHLLIHSDVNLIPWAKWLDAHGIYGLDLAKGLRFDRSFLAIEAAAEGLGVILDSDLLAARELASGRLMHPFEGAMMPIRTAQHFFVAPASKMKLPRVLRFRDWLFEGIRRDFEGK